jgi:hypothetical protein
MTLVMAAGLIYSALVLGAFAKYYYYYHIRGSNLLLCPIMPLILFVIIPISMTFDILKYNTTSLWTKLFYTLVIFIFSVFSYPTSIGISAVYITTNNDDSTDNTETIYGQKNADNWGTAFELYDFFICRLSESISHLHRRLA